jgi:hypothetical protein
MRRQEETGGGDRMRRQEEVVTEGGPRGTREGLMFDQRGEGRAGPVIKS